MGNRSGQLLCSSVLHECTKPHDPATMPLLYPMHTQCCYPLPRPSNGWPCAQGFLYHTLNMSCHCQFERDAKRDFPPCPVSFPRPSTLAERSSQLLVQPSSSAHGTMYPGLVIAIALWLSLSVSVNAHIGASHTAPLE